VGAETLGTGHGKHRTASRRQRWAHVAWRGAQLSEKKKTWGNYTELGPVRTNFRLPTDRGIKGSRRRHVSNFVRIFHGKLVDIFMLTRDTSLDVPEVVYSLLIRKGKYTSTHINMPVFCKLCSADLRWTRTKTDQLKVRPCWTWAHTSIITSTQSDHRRKWFSITFVLTFTSRWSCDRHIHGCFKKSFTTLKAYINLFRGHVQCFELSWCSKNTPSFTWDSYGSLRVPLVVQGVSKTALQRNFECYCVASVKANLSPSLIKQYAKGTRGEWRNSCTTLGPGNRWRWVSSFTPRQLYPHGKSFRYP
jgi:hypothetical protein